MIATASMIAILHSLARTACFSSLNHSVVMNFNNGEENGLFGGDAFTLHPLFKNIKAFLNLEGTGASMEYTELLFRTNSYPLVSLLMNTNPFPHSSIMANQVMRMLQSDTDYRPYSATLPGADFAFYTDRYLYHTAYDDINHTSAKSMQHMSSNILSSIYSIMNSTFLEHAQVDPDLESNPSTEDLPIPSFLFYDRCDVLSEP
jgi:Zn-dependent M28 family amino/carboxypeptidase